MRSEKVFLWFLAFLFGGGVIALIWWVYHRTKKDDTADEEETMTPPPPVKEEEPPSPTTVIIKEVSVPVPVYRAPYRRRWGSAPLIWNWTKPGSPHSRRRKHGHRKRKRNGIFH